MAKLKTETISAELGIQRVLMLKNPQSSFKDLSAGQALFIYRENDKPHKWIGPFKAL